MKNLRHLNKIIFIQSADIDYQEIALDGNVHFIGDQGAGKSTILRAILFLYNADTLRLGIPKSNTKFLDYYFQETASTIIYEIKGSHHTFLIWLKKENNRVAYHFVNTSYRKDSFLEKVGKNFRSLKADKVKSNFRAKKIQISNKISYYKHFRDVFYGAESRNEFKPFAIMQSLTYHNIPNAIQNVFLNANLESANIKRTIIHSLHRITKNRNDNNDIDLGNIRKELQEFEADFKDIEIFKKRNNDAEKIIDLYKKLEAEKELLVENAQKLGESYLYFQKHEKTVEEHEKKAKIEFEQIEKSVKELAKTSLAEERILDNEIAILKSDLKKAKKQQEHWATMKYSYLVGIDNILEKAATETAEEERRNETVKKLDILGSQFKNIDQKYGTLLELAKISYNNNVNRLEEGFNKAENENLIEKKSINEAFNVALEQIDAKSETKTKGFYEEKETLQAQESTFRVEEMKIRGTAFRVEEIKDISTTITGFREQIRENNHLINNLDKDIKNFKTGVESEKKRLATDFEREQKQIAGEKQGIEKEIFDLHKKLENFEDSFYKYLNDNYEGWQTKFGKVCDERILFHTNLKPSLQKVSEYFYGLTLDLSAVENKVKSIAEYEQERKDFIENLNLLTQKLTTINVNFSEESTKLDAKYNKKIRDLNKQIKEQRNENLKHDRSIESLKLDKLDVEQKAKEEKNEKLESIRVKISEVKAKILEVRAKIDTQNKLKRGEKEVLRSEKKANIAEIDAVLRNKQKNIETEKAKNEQKYKLEKQDLADRKIAELSGEGADTKSIQELEKALEKVERNLRFIEKIKKYIDRYKVEKKNIDKIPIWQKTITEKAYNFDVLQEINRGKMSNLKIEMKQKRQQCNDLKDEMKDIKREIEAFLAFLEIYKEDEIVTIIMQAKETVRHDKLSVLREKIEYHKGQIEDFSKELGRKNRQFLSFFRTGNILSFPKQLDTKEEHIKFAQMLKAYMDSDKLNDAVIGINKMYANLLQGVRGKIDLLLVRRKDIDSTIASINKDFAKSNFVKAIEFFEMKTKDTSNEIVQILEKIKHFIDENDTQIGSISLFSKYEKTEEIKRESMRLIEMLSKSLGKNIMQTAINLQDTFELQFKATQNGKTTGWKDKLSDIGSHGTDVLLKAMIYIMLLHVFKEKAIRKTRFKDFGLHCIMDEIGRIHSKNIKGLIEFANVRGIWMIFGSPEENDALAYKYVYNLEKQNHKTVATRLIYDKRK